MSRLKLKQSEVSQFKCIWCGGSPRTKEHLWPQWFARIVPQESMTSHPFHKVIINNGNEMEISERKQSGNAASRTLKIVCNPCNGGWMSLIEDEARLVLKPLLGGESRDLSAVEVQSIVNWVALKTFICQYTVPDLIFLNEIDRKKFYERRELQYNWFIWLGKYSGTEQKVRNGISHLKYHTNLDSTLNLPEGDNILISNFVGGGLVVHTIVSRHPLVTDIKLEGLQDYLLQLYPSSGAEIHFPPPQSMGSTELTTLLNALNSQIRGPKPVLSL